MTEKIKQAEPDPTIPLADFKEVMQQLANAIIQSRQPYVSDAQKANEELFRKSTLEIEERKRKAVEADQASCQHFQGSNALSEIPGTLTSIVWHDLGNGTIFGLCTNCLRQFWPTDPDYVTQFRRKSGNKISGAGQRRFLTPMVPQTRPTIETPTPSVDVPETVSA